MIPLIEPFVTSQNSELRYAATHALVHFPIHPEAVQLLQRLCDDPDGDVRNWSLFALGSLSDVDTPSLREVFVNHLNDSFHDAREEAIAGLAKRNDERAAQPLIRLLQKGSYSAHLEWDFAVLAGLTSDAVPITSDRLLEALQRRFGSVRDAYCTAP